MCVKKKKKTTVFGCAQDFSYKTDLERCGVYYTWQWAMETLFQISEILYQERSEFYNDIDHLFCLSHNTNRTQ